MKINVYNALCLISIHYVLAIIIYNWKRYTVVLIKNNYISFASNEVTQCKPYDG